MKVLNRHTRIIKAPIHKTSEILLTLGTVEDRVWPIGKWPRMIFHQGMDIGALGGHGPIRYTIKSKTPGKSIEFQFVKPKGFHGTHGFNIEGASESTTQITHTIEMNTSFIGYMQWLLAIRWLHGDIQEYEIAI
ncbi:MAG: hypothetical protein HKN68_14830 [Saprospiraceae bacterium]|nr:hypothetical protein [Saprospiraceae bacterium]